MVGGHNSTASGWGRVADAGAWTSRTYSSRSGLSRLEYADFSAVKVVERLQKNPAWTEVPSSFKKELISLKGEKDPELFYAGLLALGGRLEGIKRSFPASQLYAEINATSLSSVEIRDKARRRLDDLRGVGDFGARTETLLGQFVDQATDPATLAAFCAGGLAFRATRAALLHRLLQSPARGFFISPLGARAAAATGAFLVEVPVFTLTGMGLNRALDEAAPWDLNSVARQMASGGLLLGSVRLAGLGMGRIFPNPRYGGIFRQGGILGGILLGHHMEVTLGLREPAGAGSAVAEGLAALLQFQVAGRISKNLLRGRWSDQESPPNRFRAPQWENLFPGLATISTKGPSPLAWVKGRPLPYFSQPIQMSQIGQGGSSTGVEALLRRFRPRFPAQGPEVFSDKVLQAALRIDFPPGPFQERFLEALARAPNRGSRHQLFSVRALEDVFKVNAMHSSTGSFDYALLQNWVTEALRDTPWGTAALLELFSAMESGLNRGALESLYAKWGYGQVLKPPSVPSYGRMLGPWFAGRSSEGFKSLGTVERTLLSHFIRQESQGSPWREQVITEIFSDGVQNPHYDSSEIAAALNYAGRHPQGQLAFRRLLHILAVGDVPGKIRETYLSHGQTDTPQLLNRMAHMRLDAEQMAQQILGTAHNGYLSHMASARKVVRVMLEGARYLADPGARLPAKQRMDLAIMQFLSSGDPFGPDELLSFLGTNPTPLIREMEEAVQNREVVIEIVSPERLQWESRGLPGISDITAFFRAKRNGPAQFFIKELPNFDRETWEGQLKGYLAIVQRMPAIIHEYEHWRHSRGRYSGVEKSSPPMDLFRPNREERLASEIMAHLEEELWRVSHLDSDTWEIARQLGQPLPLYLRDFGDEGNFRIQNEAKLEERLGPGK